MKKLAKFSVFLLVLFGVLFASGCSLGDDDNGGPGYTDDPLAGKMTAATANKIFDVDYTANAPGVTLNKFKNADALQAYLNRAGAGTPFFINEIEGKPVVAIGAGAFDEDAPDVPALPGGLADIKLPATIKDVGAGAFKITSVTISLLIPETVLSVLAENDPAILYEISQSLTIKKISAGSEEGEAVEPNPAYRIELASTMSNGTVTVTGNPKSAAVGATITLTPAPASGYKYTEGTLSVTKKDDSGTAVELTLVAGDTRTFSMPAFDVRVSAMFEPLPEGEYSVTINNLTHGNIIPSPTYGPAGTEITLTVTPASGYRLNGTPTVTKTGESETVSVNGTGSGLYTFSLPASDVTVSAVFEGIPADGPIQIKSATDMAKIGNSLPANGKYILAADITLPNWTPLGTGTAPFSGVFDGAGHKITMTGTLSSVAKAMPADWIEDFGTIATTMQVAGLFGNTNGAEIKNLNVVWNGNSLSFSDGSVILCAGIVAGWAENTDFTDVMVTGGTFSVDAYFPIQIGGLAGNTEGGILRCGSTVNVTVTARAYGATIGGLVGTNWRGEIGESFASGNVTTTGCERIGGLAGDGRSIRDSYAAGNVIVSGGNVGASSIRADRVAAGGLVGQVEPDEGMEVTISKSYARGTISATADGEITRGQIGGISGNIYFGYDDSSCEISGCAALNGSIEERKNRLSSVVQRITNDYNWPTLSNNIANRRMSGGTWSSDPNGPDGDDCAAKPTQNVFTDTLGWDFSTIWKMGGDGYPVLQWQD
ncbi:MAG: hypothetical protein LBQ57_13605 [Spirochaetales bacterium]|nr:hypothetical protein [Spirochaetales bacterium]